MSQKSNVLNYIELLDWSAWGIHYATDNDWMNWAESNDLTPNLSQDLNKSQQPSVSFIPINHRKRLSTHTKISLHLLNNLSNKAVIKNTQFVIASRYGEACSTTELLDALGTNSPGSPMIFSRSVLNSAIGLHSILTGNTKTHVAISAFENTFKSGLIEAIVRSHSSKDQIVYLYVDDVVPKYFSNYVNFPPSPIGLALLIKAKDSISNLIIDDEINLNPFSILKEKHNLESA